MKAPTLALVLVAVVFNTGVLADSLTETKGIEINQPADLVQSVSDQGLQSNFEDNKVLATAGTYTDRGTLSWPRAQYQEPVLDQEPQSSYNYNEGAMVDEVIPRAVDNVEGLREISRGKRPNYVAIKPATPDIVYSQEAPVTKSRVRPKGLY